MKYDPHFDVDAALRTLESISHGFQDGSPEEASLRAAAAALVYVRELGKLDDYREFFRQITTRAIESVKASHEFTTREAADEWLKGVSAPDGELVSIAGKGYQVVNLPQGAPISQESTPSRTGEVEEGLPFQGSRGVDFAWLHQRHLSSRAPRGLSRAVTESRARLSPGSARRPA